ncbi:MAG: hypothetical protein SNJ82_02115 [Gemmataceae bacterium]
MALHSYQDTRERLPYTAKPDQCNGRPDPWTRQTVPFVKVLAVAVWPAIRADTWKGQISACHLSSLRRGIGAKSCCRVQVRLAPGVNDPHT